MKYCTNCGKELSDEMIFCPDCGHATDLASNNAPSKPPMEDKVHIGLCVLAFFIPLFGLIYWLIARNETPKKANAVGLTALISWIINIVMSIIFSVLYAGILAAVFSTVPF